MSEDKGPEDYRAAMFRRFVNAVYWTGAAVACAALVLVSAVIPWAVYTRYILNSASSWPEPMAVLLTVGITFIGSANCYRQRIHMNMTVGTDLLPPSLRRASLLLSELLMGVIAIFMFVWGLKLVQTTWGNSVLDLQSNKIDIFFGLNPTPKRALVVDFSVPVFNNAFGILCKKDFKPKSGGSLNLY